MTVESAADQALALKKRARRRLVGAVALVLLMLIILPNVLKDREQVEQRAPITLTMPEEMQTAPEAAVPENPTTEQANIAAPEAENTTPPVPAENLAAPQASPTISPPADSPPVETPKAAEIPAKIVLATPKADVKNTVTPEVAKPKDAKNTRFLIQVGVFSDAENVKKLQTKISEAGFSSRTAKLNTPKGEKIRLRVGSFVTRDAAAEALKKLEAHGLSGMVLLDE